MQHGWLEKEEEAASLCHHRKTLPGPVPSGLERVPCIPEHGKADNKGTDILCLTYTP